MMPGVDGIVQVMEGASGEGEGDGRGDGKHWCTDGVEVDLNLGWEAVERLGC